MINIILLWGYFVLLIFLYGRNRKIMGYVIKFILVWDYSVGGYGWVREK